MQSAFFTIISSAENPFIMTVFTGQRWCWASVHVMFCVPGNCNMLMLQSVFSLFQVLSPRLTSNVEMGTCIAKPTILEHPFVSQHEAYMQFVVPSLWCQFCGAVMAVWSSLWRRNHSQGSLECCQASVQIGLSECIQGWLAGWGERDSWRTVAAGHCCVIIWARKDECYGCGGYVPWMYKQSGSRAVHAQTLGIGGFSGGGVGGKARLEMPAVSNADASGARVCCISHETSFPWS